MIEVLSDRIFNMSEVAAIHRFEPLPSEDMSQLMLHKAELRKMLACGYKLTEAMY